MTGLLALLSGLGAALAGGGPWVISPGDGSIYLGTSVERFSRLATSNGKYADDVLVLDDGATKYGLQLMATYGLLPRAELDVTVPWQYNRFNRTDGEFCASLGQQGCTTTSGFAPVRGRLKFQVLDELYGAPLSLASGIGLRQGQYTAPERARATSLGEGTTDLEVFLSMGRYGLLGSAFWNGSVDATFRYRLPNTYSESLVPIPGTEILVNAEVLFGGPSPISIGPTISMFWRPQGVDWKEVDLDDPDRFAALNARAIQLGSKLILRSSERVVLAMATMWTVAAKNNPSDGFLLSVGIQIFQQKPIRLGNER